ncbi:MAG TPA: Rieske (2Fe-2S) protein [Polyangiaceae bacterium]
MTLRYKLGTITQIPEGEGRVFAVGAQNVAVFRTRDGSVFATQAECPHRKGPLSDGLLGKSTLVCPLHEWKFDLHTGKSLNGNCELTVYRVAQDESGELTLEL